MIGGVSQSLSPRVFLRTGRERAGEWLGDRERDGPMRGVRCVLVAVELLPLLGRRAVRNEDEGDEEIMEDEDAIQDVSTSTARLEPSHVVSDEECSNSGRLGLSEETGTGRREVERRPRVDDRDIDVGDSVESTYSVIARGGGAMRLFLSWLE